MRRRRFSASAADLDAVQFAPTNMNELQDDAIARANGSDELVAGVLETVTWSFVRNVAHSVEQRFGMAWNDHGIRYPVEDKLDPGETPFAGVHVYNPVSETYVPREAFERLIVRWLRAAGVAAERRRHPEADPRELDAIANRVEQRLREESPEA